MLKLEKNSKGGYIATFREFVMSFPDFGSLSYYNGLVLMIPDVLKVPQTRSGEFDLYGLRSYLVEKVFKNCKSARQLQQKFNAVIKALEL